jgi:two-component system chemotaxis response regulator CheY
MEGSTLPYSALIIDDSAHMRILLSKLLQRNGFTNVDVAVNGAEGVQHFKAQNPDVVFLDAVMPEMDGLTALQEIKKLEAQTIVVITTSLSEREKVLQFKEAGADYYLLKPFEDKKLVDTLQKIVAILDQRAKKV